MKPENNPPTPPINSIALIECNTHKTKKGASVMRFSQIQHRLTKTRQCQLTTYATYDSCDWGAVIEGAIIMPPVYPNMHQYIYTC